METSAWKPRTGFGFQIVVVDFVHVEAACRWPTAQSSSILLFQ